MTALTQKMICVDDLNFSEVQFAFSAMLCSKILPWDFTDTLYALRNVKKVAPAKTDRTVGYYQTCIMPFVEKETLMSLSKSWKVLTSGGAYELAAAMFNSVNNASYQGANYFEEHLPRLKRLGKLLLKATKLSSTEGLSLKDKEELVYLVHTLGRAAKRHQEGSGAFFLSVPSLRAAGSNEESVIGYFKELPYIPDSLVQKLSKKHKAVVDKLSQKPKALVVPLFG